jgi:hypothetical protein
MVAVLAALAGCGRQAAREVKQEPETIARTEFTERIENFFEYEPLTPGAASKFLIHLTDLTDGSPVEGADVTLSVRQAGASDGPTSTKARVGRVTGIYIAEVTVPVRDTYTIEFRVKTAKLDERMRLDGFTTR